MWTKRYYSLIFERQKVRNETISIPGWLFHKYEKIHFNEHSNIISPVEATVAFIGDINNQGQIISKNNKKINLVDVMGEQATNFIGGNYINLYLVGKK